jgi:outer membrane receptor protein involved in Fe transport
LNINKTFGADERIQANFGVENILNDKREVVFSSYEAQDQIFTRLAPGTRINFGFSFTF